MAALSIGDQERRRLERPNSILLEIKDLQHQVFLIVGSLTGLRVFGHCMWNIAFES